MHSYLITGGSYEDRKKKECDFTSSWNVLPFDIYRIDMQADKQSIGIEDIRFLTQNLSLAPRSSPVVVGIIDRAEQLTVEAQNALLKTLEEPPIKARLILEAGNSSQLLPTISSRCQSIPCTTATSVSPEEQTTILSTVRAFQGKRPGEICQLVNQLFETKEDGVRFLQNFLIFLHDRLHSAPKKAHQDQTDVWSDLHIVYMIRSIIRAQKLLSANVQYTLVFDDFFHTILLDKA